MDWLTQRSGSTEGDIQSAIQSQVIQTALEKEDTGLNDIAFQSFLSSAPIPRFYADTLLAPASLAAGGASAITWSQTGGYYNPFAMLVPSTGSVTTPIDGFYTFALSYNGTSTGAATARAYFLVGGVITALNTAPPVTGTAVVQVTATMVAPLRASTIVQAFVLNDSGTALVANAAQLGAVWSGPYTNYGGG